VLHADSYGLEGHRNQCGRRNREAQVPFTEREQPAQADHDHRVHTGDERGQHHKHQRLVDHDVDVIEPIPQHRHRNGEGDDQQGDEDERPRGAVIQAQPGEGHGEQHGCAGDPLELLALDSPRPTVAHH